MTIGINSSALLLSSAGQTLTAMSPVQYRDLLGGSGLDQVTLSVREADTLTYHVGRITPAKAADYDSFAGRIFFEGDKRLTPELFEFLMSDAFVDQATGTKHHQAFRELVKYIEALRTPDSRKSYFHPVFRLRFASPLCPTGVWNTGFIRQFRDCKMQPKQLIPEGVSKADGDPLSLARFDSLWTSAGSTILPELSPKLENGLFELSTRNLLSLFEIEAFVLPKFTRMSEEDLTEFYDAIKIGWDGLYERCEDEPWFEEVRYIFTKLETHQEYPEIPTEYRQPIDAKIRELLGHPVLH